MQQDLNLKIPFNVKQKSKLNLTKEILLNRNLIQAHQNGFSLHGTWREPKNSVQIQTVTPRQPDKKILSNCNPISTRQFFSLRHATWPELENSILIQQYTNKKIKSTEPQPGSNTTK